MNAVPEVVNWRALVAKKPGIHAFPPGQLSFFALPDDVLEYLASGIDENTRTLETGLGASTLVFAVRRSQHTCVAPVVDEIERVKAFCSENGVDTAQINFVADYSESALPRLELPELDLVLIDGRHGFPAPIVDWYYSANHLKVGGRLIVDDVNLWSVQLLIEYLSTSNSWRIDRAFSRTLCFVRTSSGDQRAEWINQQNVQDKTAQLQARWRRQRQFSKARELACSGRIDIIVKKAIRCLLRRS